MKILGAILAICGLFKVYFAFNINMNDIEQTYNLDFDSIQLLGKLGTFLIIESLLEIGCGAFILFI